MAGLQIYNTPMILSRFDPAAQAIIDAMTTQPDSARKQLINDTVVSLKDNGLWTKFDFPYFIAANARQSGYLNWVDPGNGTDITDVVAPTFTADRGIQGNGSTQYVNTNFIPSASGNANIGNVSHGIWILDNQFNNNYFDYGIVDNGSVIRLNSRRGDNTFQVQAFTGSGDTASNFNSAGFFGVTKDDSAGTFKLYKNGNPVGNGTTLNNAYYPNKPIYIGCYNNAGTPTGFSPRKIAFNFLSSALDDTDWANLYTIVQNYLSAIGAI